MSAISLYRLSTEMQRLAEFLAEQDFDAVTVANTIESTGLPDAIAEKAQAIELVARTLEAHNPAAEAEIDRLRALVAQRARAARELRDYLRRHMLMCGIDKIDAPYFKLRLQNNPPAVEVFDERMVPAEFIRQPEVPPAEIDRKAIAQAIRHGKEVPGALLIQTKRLVVT